MPPGFSVNHIVRLPDGTLPLFHVMLLVERVLPGTLVTEDVVHLGLRLVQLRSHLFCCVLSSNGVSWSSRPCERRPPLQELGSILSCCRVLRKVRRRELANDLYRRHLVIYSAQAQVGKCSVIAPLLRAPYVHRAPTFSSIVLWLPREDGLMELITTSFGFLYAMLDDELALLHRRW